MQEGMVACAFCGRAGRESEMKVTGGGWYMCIDCVDDHPSEAIKEDNIEEKVVNAKVMNGIIRFINEITRLEKDAGSVQLALKIRKLRNRVKKEGTVADIEGIAGELWQLFDDHTFEVLYDTYDRGYEEGATKGYDDGYRDGSDNNEDY